MTEKGNRIATGYAGIWQRKLWAFYEAHRHEITDPDNDTYWTGLWGLFRAAKREAARIEFIYDDGRVRRVAWNEELPEAELEDCDLILTFKDDSKLNLGSWEAA